MIAEVVLDTNVLVYATSRAPDDAEKRSQALSLLQTHRIGLSGQILQEFFVVTTRKSRVPLTPSEALEWIEELEAFPFVPIDAGLVKVAAEMAGRYRVSYWDAAVLAAAERLRAEILYTEDLSHGQTYGTVRVLNPFRTH
jgi:predicted nucleic acid-binding protein